MIHPRDTFTFLLWLLLTAYRSICWLYRKILRRPDPEGLPVSWWEI